MTASTPSACVADAPRLSLRSLATPLASLCLGLALIAPAGQPAAGDPAEQRMIVLTAPADTAEVAGRVAPRAGTEVVETMPRLGVVVVDTTDPATLEQVREVQAVVPNVAVTPSLDRSVPLTGAPLAHAQGHDGTGTWVAVLDTGVDLRHQAFAGTPVREACFAPHGSACPNGTAQQIGPGAAFPGACDGCAHGTHVAGIAVGRASPTASTGMAPDAGLLAVQVFNRPSAPSAEPAADLQSLLSGLAWIEEQAAELDIAAVNLSVQLNSVITSGPCDGHPVVAPLVRAFAALAARDVAVVVSAGNLSDGFRGSTGQIPAPGCISSALTVSSTTVAQPGRISSFADVGSQVDLLAPGEGIRSAGPNGTALTLQGTSMAAPHVSGAVAVLAERHAGTARSHLGRLLVHSGRLLQDPRGTYPTLDVAAVYRRATGDSIALRAGSTYRVRHANVSGEAAQVFGYGRPEDEVFVGDWDGNGTDTLAIRRGNVFHLRNTLSAGPAETTFGYGRPGDEVFVGDWDGNGTDTLAIRRGNVFHLRNTLSAGPAELLATFGRATDVALTGDWNGDGTDTLAVRRGSRVFLADSIVSGQAEWHLDFGSPLERPLSGNFDGL